MRPYNLNLMNRDSLDIRYHIFWVCSQDHKDQDGEERVSRRTRPTPTFMPNQTENDLAAIEDANHLISGCFVVVDFEQFLLGESEESLG